MWEFPQSEEDQTLKVDEKNCRSYRYHIKDRRRKWSVLLNYRKLKVHGRHICPIYWHHILRAG